ncbi:MAG TPA: hypothetical protein PLL78_05975 [Fimbriimonadaceae bacterium]|nr:hypothetical protein [Fimbriimonadaceae bacterium]HRJ96215.1 hypothetical protein [Fimbriimonadaceae bacterium]
MRRSDSRLARFFAVWGEFVDRLMRLLVTLLACICIIGGLQFPAYGGPQWLGYSVAGFGVLLLILNVLKRR